MKHKKLLYSLIIVNSLLLLFKLPLYAQNKQVSWTKADYLHGFGFTGTGIVINIFEDDRPMEGHAEFEDRLYIQPGLPYQPADAHATAISSVAIAKGLNPFAKGTAFTAHARMFLAEYPYDVMALEGILHNHYPLSTRVVSNHSYGRGIENLNFYERAQLFGAYKEESADLDHLCFKNPYLLPVVAAGNHNLKINESPIAFGYDKIVGGITTAKNVLLVANIDEASFGADGKLLHASIHETSSCGPTDDLRVKPDIAAPGTEITVAGVESTDPAVFTTTSYSSVTGTSVSAPAVAGIVALLQQYYFTDYKTYMKAATVKGLLMHTADKINTNFSREGPDAYSGYGLVNAQSATNALINRGNTSIVDERRLEENDVDDTPLPTTPGQQVIVSISWTDDMPTNQDAISAPSSPPNISTGSLLNDLDVYVLEKNAQGLLANIFYPYRFARTTNGDFTVMDDDHNHKDNYEQVRFIPKKDFTYEAIVTYYGPRLNQGGQDYSLIVTGLDEDPDINEGTCPAEVVIQNSVDIGSFYSATGSIHLNADITAYAGATLLAAPHVLLNSASVLNGDLFVQTDGCMTNTALSRNAVRLETGDFSSRRYEVITQDSIIIYPNPATHNIMVKNTGRSAIRFIQLFGTDGNVLQHARYKDMQQITLNIEKLAAGIYYLVITKEDGTITRKKWMKSY